MIYFMPSHAQLAPDKQGLFSSLLHSFNNRGNAYIEWREILQITRQNMTKRYYVWLYNSKKPDKPNLSWKS